MWELAHRRREEAESTTVQVEADSSEQAIDQLRQQVPADHLILFVRSVDRPAPLVDR